MPQHHPARALIAFGANLPSREMTPSDTILSAAGWLSANGPLDLQLSALYHTPCFPAGAGPDYVNAAAIVTPRYNLDAKSLLQLLHRAEGVFGRLRTGRWAGRTLDIDLLAMDDSVLPDAETQARWRNLSRDDQRRLTPDQIILPHPRLQDRAFVLVPLADLAPDWCHPLLNLTVAQMLAATDPADRAAVRRV